ncbi:type 1 glutamine amidotransferase [Marimonas arenosa]|uniref:Type 1 glutamine amidotransferase n=1 Tax=Marimonas arenosa TaxID=1795305 RepID=A0AAE4B570_9RHOB|nr:type 1 glutamine amidotransferase [Marimonas arenosa]MDQ2091758.1 type 1 glutamine amidotransferase [Marimonas arenosa]
MRIAILMSNTDESDFAQAHPKDGEKWRARLMPLCPDCEFPVYSVKDGHFPEHVSGYDGVIVTGSPASVHDLDPWLPRLFSLIREAFEAGVPLFGACFGHQAIALALGGAVSNNPGGWVFGTIQTEVTAPAPWMDGGPVRQYAAHIEQVTRLPRGATVTMANAGCPVGGFVIGRKVFTTQYHPEMNSEFIAALIEELADQKPPEVIAAARASLSERADNAKFARWIMEFFRQEAG